MTSTLIAVAIAGALVAWRVFRTKRAPTDFERWRENQERGHRR